MKRSDVNWRRGRTLKRSDGVDLVRSVTDRCGKVGRSWGATEGEEVEVWGRDRVLKSDNYTVSTGRSMARAKEVVV